MNAGDSMHDLVQFVRSLVESGEKLYRQGTDLIRLLPNGEVIRVEGFFGLADLSAAEDVALDATLSWLLSESQISNQAVQVAQANTAAGADPLQVVTPNTSMIAKVAEVVGTVGVVRDGSFIQLSTGDAIYLGDVINTQTNARVKLNFLSVDGSAVTSGSAEIADMTRVLVTGQIVNTDSGKYLLANFRVDTGSLNVGNLPAAEVRVQVQTPAGEMTVPQTGLNVVVQPNNGPTSVRLPSGEQASVPVVFQTGLSA